MRHRSCCQVCYTKGVSAYLPAFLQGRTLMGLLSAPSALVDVVVDSDRHVLYTRSATSVIKARLTEGSSIPLSAGGVGVHTCYAVSSMCYADARSRTRALTANAAWSCLAVAAVPCSLTMASCLWQCGRKEFR